MQAAVCSACKRPVKSSELLAADREMGCVPRSLVRRPVGGGGAKLSGGQFRMLNEALYTTTGDKALRMVEDQPGMFSAYHAGFREQTKEWPVRPVDACLKWLATQPQTLRVADFGCGDAELAARAPQKTVHSFDLESEAKGVVACNMANVP